MDIALIILSVCLSCADVILGIVGLIKKNFIIGIIGTVLSGITILFGIFWCWWQILFGIAGLILGILTIVFVCTKNKKKK